MATKAELEIELERSKAESDSLRAQLDEIHRNQFGINESKKRIEAAKTRLLQLEGMNLVESERGILRVHYRRIIENGEAYLTEDN